MGSFKVVQFKVEAVTGPVSKRTHFRTPRGYGRQAIFGEGSSPFRFQLFCLHDIADIHLYSMDIGTLGIL